MSKIFRKAFSRLMQKNSKPSSLLGLHYRSIIYVPPPDNNPRLVRDESVLKALVLTGQPKYPISIKRLDEIRESPKGWLPPIIPPPELPFEMKRNSQGRFNIQTNRLKSRAGGKIQYYTLIKNIRGDIYALQDCIRWRLGETTFIRVLEKSKTLVVAGYHPRTMHTLFLGFGF